MQEKKRILSGMQPSGQLTLGNYLGAMKNWVAMQEDYHCLYCIVDLHALTVRQDPQELRANTLSVLAQYIACGLNPDKNIIFIQSHVSAHAELAWVLNCYTYIGELSRMTQFKEKSAKHADNINAGLFTYPVLMAADILLYQTHLVPVGHDQKQHLEIARDIALRFNNLYGDVFLVPEVYLPKVGARIMSLQEPLKKMAKSDENVHGNIAILDSQEAILRKFKRAVTDSDARVAYDVQAKPGVSNLMSIYSSVTGKTYETIAAEFDGKGYGDFKAAVGEAVAETLRPVRTRYQELMASKDYLQQVMQDGASQADRLARSTLQKVYQKVGLILPSSR